ncbi:hypothetical protein GC170_08455 [bacterium]|nr:hypothetical protein [bacterium]
MIKGQLETSGWNIPAYLAIVAYRALVAGGPTCKVDIQVSWFDDDDPDSICRTIESEPAMTQSKRRAEARPASMRSRLRFNPSETAG